MPETRRTNPGFLSNNESARDRKRTQDFVRSISETKQMDTKNEPSTIESKSGNQKKQEKTISITPEFWGSNKGLIVRAIVLNRAYKKDTILKVTKLRDQDYRQAATELFLSKLLTEKSGGYLWVTKDLYWQCKNFFKP